MSVGLMQLLVILLIILVLFGAGRLPQVMQQLGKGVRMFKESVEEKDDKKNDHEQDR